MKKISLPQPPESFQQPLFLKQLSPKMQALLEKHFWCDFSDVIPSLSWEQDQTPN